MNEIECPRSAPRLILATFALYRRFPWLWLVLAAAVVVPYEVIVLLATGVGPFTHARVNFGVSWLLIATDSFLVTPLVSALHVHAVDDVRAGQRPALASVARRGVVTLPVVSAAAIISWLGIFAGLIALIVPGIMLMLRWSVVAQAAALEDESWTDALRRSTELSHDRYWHVFWVLVIAGLVGFIPNLLLGHVFGHTTTTAGSFVAGTALNVLIRSFTALATALLYFDLSTRLRTEPSRRSHMPPPLLSDAPSHRAVEPTGHPLDPDSYAEEDRPPGWYVDPDKPWRMRYWAADGEPGWSKRTAKTPKRTLAGWHKVNDR
ncbi:MAG TPA: hypothetical protein VHE08_02815 [Solirubrobacterales bacterium]|nr:hypothetical protein [Solirubrobacterales bacterium]